MSPDRDLHGTDRTARESDTRFPVDNQAVKPELLELICYYTDIEPPTFHYGSFNKEQMIELLWWVQAQSDKPPYTEQVQSQRGPIE